MDNTASGNKARYRLFHVSYKSKVIMKKHYSVTLAQCFEFPFADLIIINHSNNRRALIGGPIMVTGTLLESIAHYLRFVSTL